MNRGHSRVPAPADRSTCSVLPGTGESLDDLLVQIAEGSRTAFARLYDHTAPLVFAAAVEATSSPTAAEERVAASYVRIWKSAAAYRPGPDAISWILHQTRGGDG
ncbi:MULTISPECIES: hypothetical protein [unclassified Streptomyces]|uniref:hypothetical protein n=1 Tax=unclassified Streptomyces TaxID=2593676 RepID=UPI002E2BFD64|nr:hypothetical protein [Streptomyces sp. NBC_01429]